MAKSRLAAPRLLLLLLLFACEAAEQREAGLAREPEALADQEDAVCGMLVRDQSAPRAQVVHRDGARFFFCSLGDLMTRLYLRRGSGT